MRVIIADDEQQVRSALRFILEQEQSVEMVFEFDRARAPENFDAEIGQRLQMYRADGQPVNITVIGKSEKAFTMDCNHDLAGKDLIFDVRLEEIL